MPLNRIQVIEASRDGLVAQGSWAIKNNAMGERMCAYLTPEGHKCAIGVLPGFPAGRLANSECGIGTLLELDAEVKALFTDDVTPQFLNRIQETLHDMNAYHNRLPFDPQLVIDAANVMLEREQNRKDV